MIVYLKRNINSFIHSKQNGSTEIAYVHPIGLYGRRLSRKRKSIILLLSFLYYFFFCK